MEEKILTGYSSIDKPWLDFWPVQMLEGRKTFERIIDNVQDVWTDGDEVMINYYDTGITVNEFFARVDAVAKSLIRLVYRKGIRLRLL